MILESFVSLSVCASVEGFCYKNHFFQCTINNSGSFCGCFLSQRLLETRHPILERHISKEILHPTKDVMQSNKSKLFTVMSHVCPQYHVFTSLSLEVFSNRQGWVSQGHCLLSLDTPTIFCVPLRAFFTGSFAFGGESDPELICVRRDWVRNFKGWVDICCRYGVYCSLVL